MKKSYRSFGKESEHGVALILVMLCLLVLTVLVASIIFSARSESFASYNYRISTQADYVAKAGLQRALNFFNSNKYTAVPPGSATATYDVSQYSSTPVVLYNGKENPVQCIANCATTNGAVVLSMDSSGSFNGNYPTNLTNSDGDTIPTAFKNRFYNISLDPLGSANNSGQFTVTATLREFVTVNDAFYPSTNLKPFEVWHVVSTGTWNSNVGAGNNKPTSVQEADLAPVYLPYFANALYGMCSLTLNGNVCTDSFTSRSGTYNGSNPANCVSGSGASNAFASGAGVGAGGGIVLNGTAYIVSGNASYGAATPTYSAPWACPPCSGATCNGLTGSEVGIRGAVVPVPPIPQPPMPTFPTCSWYGTAGNCNSQPGVYPTPADPTNLGNNDYAWVKKSGTPWVYEVSIGGTVTDYDLTAGTFGSWAASTLYSTGNTITATASDGQPHLYVAQNSGVSGTTTPSFPATSGATVTESPTFTSWLASHSYAQGALVVPSPSNGYLYQATNHGGGVSGASAPAWPTSIGATVTDGTGGTKITWTNIGAAVGLTWKESGLPTTNPYGSGTAADPFRLPAVSMGNNSSMCLAGGDSSSTAIYYDIEDFSSSGTTYIVKGSSPPTACPPQAGYSQYGYAVVNIYKTLTLGGPGVTQPAGAAPASLVISVYNQGNNSGTSVTLNGQANLKAIVTALGNATLGGGGTGGAFYGSLLAGSVTDGGTYAVHFDQSLQVASGKLMPMSIRNYSRPKY